MYEYKVLTLSVHECEKKLNELAKEGWRLVAMSSNVNLAIGMGVIVTMEKAA